MNFSINSVTFISAYETQIFSIVGAIKMSRTSFYNKYNSQQSSPFGIYFPIINGKSWKRQSFSVAFPTKLPFLLKTFFDSSVGLFPLAVVPYLKWLISKLNFDLTSHVFFLPTFLKLISALMGLFPLKHHAWDQVANINDIKIF